MFDAGELIEAVRGKIICGSIDAQFNNISIDSRAISLGDIFLAIKGGNFDGHDFIDEALRKGAACVIGNSRVRKYARQKTLIGLRQRIAAGAVQKVSFIEVEDTIKALGDIARFQRRKFDFPVIAVSGSAGKTTVKEMIAWILSCGFDVLCNEGTKNNQIGLPLTLLQSNIKHQLAVLELGTNHPGEIEYLANICEPNIGIITNIGPAHLEYFNNLSGVLREKYALINSLKKPRIAFLNADDVFLRKRLLKKNKALQAFSFGIKHKSDFCASNIKYHPEKLEFFVNHGNKFILKTLGCQNIYNALAAIGVARVFGIEYKDISDRLSTFNFPKSRLNFIVSNNIRFIDDTYNSNPLSLTQALDALRCLNIKGRKIFVMGDMLELGKNQELFHSGAGLTVAKICDVFVAVGKLSGLAASCAESFGLDSRNIFTCDSASKARDVLFKMISPNENDIVLVKGSRGMKMEEVFNFKL